MEFKCKQFWGTEQNMVVAQVFQHDNKKPILKVNIQKSPFLHCPPSLLQVEGEWTGRMTAKWAGGKNETFLDVSTLQKRPKIVKPVSEQEKFESRRLWREVADTCTPIHLYRCTPVQDSPTFRHRTF